MLRSTPCGPGRSAPLWPPPPTGQKSASSDPSHNIVFRTFNLIIAMTFLTLTDLLTRAGAFFLYGGLAALGTAVFYLFLPETRGRSLEEMTQLFSGPLRVDRK